MCAKKNLPHPILLDLGCSIKKKTCIQNYTERMKMTRRNKYTATMASWVSAFPPTGRLANPAHPRTPTPRTISVQSFKAAQSKAEKSGAATCAHYRRYHPGPKARATSYLRHNIYLSTKNTQKLCTLFKGYISARLQAWTNRIGPMETNFSFQSLNKAKNITRFNNK